MCQKQCYFNNSKLLQKTNLTNKMLSNINPKKNYINYKNVLSDENKRVFIDVDILI